MVSFVILLLLRLFLVASTLSLGILRDLLRYTVNGLKLSFLQDVFVGEKGALSSIEMPECRALIPLSAVNKRESEPLDATKGAPLGKKISP